MLGKGYKKLYGMICEKYKLEEYEFEDCFVCFDIKYEWEKEYYSADTIMYEDGTCLDDWYEGQTDIKLYYAIPISELRGYIINGPFSN